MGTALLHDIGKLVIAERARTTWRARSAAPEKKNGGFYVIEEELIGVSHAEVGAYLLSLWGFPAPMVEAVAHHHHPNRVPAENAGVIPIVYIANLLAHEEEARGEGGEFVLATSEINAGLVERSA